VPNAENLCVVFGKKCVLELQFECKAGIVLVVQQNWFKGLVNGLHVVVIVSQVPEFVCKHLRKTVEPQGHAVQDSRSSSNCL